jgi:hypothetical protein
MIIIAKRIIIMLGLTTISGIFPRPEVLLGILSEALSSIIMCVILGSIACY